MNCDPITLLHKKKLVCGFYSLSRVLLFHHKKEKNPNFAAGSKMGGKCPHRHVKKRRYSHKTARRTKFELKDILSQFFSLIHMLISFFSFSVTSCNNFCVFAVNDSFFSLMYVLISFFSFQLTI